MKKMLKNSEVFERLHSLNPLLSRRDRIGYIAARNYLLSLQLPGGI